MRGNYQVEVQIIVMKTESSVIQRAATPSFLRLKHAEEEVNSGREFNSDDMRTLEDAHLESLAQLSRIIELRDDRTGEHTMRVARLSGLIAQHLHISQEEIQMVYQTAPVHDIGKVVVPDSVLLKPGPLTDSERAAMREHTTLASQILKGSASKLIRVAEQVARHHHERWDGQGYPDGLRALEIPLPARIVAVADAFDAMVNDRPYRTAVPLDQVLAELAGEGGWQFDPQVIDALFRALETDQATVTPSQDLISGREA